jgi:DNA mismatch repair protein MutS2
VKGLIHEKMHGKPDFRNLAKYMDYSLQEVDQNEAPAVGIRIAEILGVDNEIIERAKKHYKG